ncbi:MAG TPA: hypothetical protein VLL97_11835 [Acidobacteriota bacterium]|nr:hypothetical protein [Acidobacteriota bacterium]
MKNNSRVIILILLLAGSAIIAFSNEITGDEERCDFSKWNPIRISHFIERIAIHGVIPEYPDEAFNQRLEGIIYVKILVGQDGNIKRACAFEDGPLGAAAEKAALEWKFKENWGPPSWKDDYAQAVLKFEFFITPEGEKAIRTFLPQNKNK